VLRGALLALEDVNGDEVVGDVQLFADDRDAAGTTREFEAVELEGHFVVVSGVDDVNGNTARQTG
jgi:hypothetical protein